MFEIGTLSWHKQQQTKCQLHFLSNILAATRISAQLRYNTTQTASPQSMNLQTSTGNIQNTQAGADGVCAQLDFTFAAASYSSRAHNHLT
jgi:hypothetical protein